MDSFLSSPEEFQLPIDIYEPFANPPNMNNEQNMSSSNQSLLNTQPLQHQYSNSQRTEPRQNNQINPLPMMQPNMPHPQQMNQNIKNLNGSDNLPSKNEVMNKTPSESDDNNPAPPSLLNLNNNTLFNQFFTFP